MFSAIAIRIFKKTPKSFALRRVVLGGCGLVNNAKWCNALKDMNIDARTLVWGTPYIYGKDTFNYDLQAVWGSWSYLIAPWVFLKTLFRADTVICGFDGFILGTTNLRKIELLLMHLAKCKVIVFSYGGDAFVYRNIRLESVAHALQISYPKAARHQDAIERDVRRNVKYADFICLGVMSFDGFGRWDALPVSWLVVDIENWKPQQLVPTNEVMTVVHTPNHRGFKGTEFLIQAVRDLQDEDLPIKLILLEGVPNLEVQRVLTEEADVLVEQLIAPGYGMSGVEGMASGLTVVANLSDDRIMTPMRRWSFLNECPVVSATPETIKEVLRKLVEQPELRKELSVLSREYAVKYHSHATFQEFYRAIDAYLFEDGEDLINFYHPVIGRSERSREKLTNPLHLNEIRSK
jgi:glycosyltransferase involved in cell wall biosynthesis